MKLSVKQLEILKMAAEGHNVLITGQCGTGKTFLMSQHLMLYRLIFMEVLCFYLNEAYAKYNYIYFSNLRLPRGIIHIIS